jgi:hypothetical protein
MDENYRIELRAYVINEIGGQGAHLFWVKVAPDGRVLEELHFVGRPGTKLHFLHLDGKNVEERRKFFSDRASMVPGSFFSYSGSKARIDQLWNIGAFAGRPLDKLYDYPSVGDFFDNFFATVLHNRNENTESNAGAYTIGRAMFPDLITSERSWTLYTPGWGLDLIEYGLKTGKIKPQDLYKFYQMGLNDGTYRAVRLSAETQERDVDAQKGMTLSDARNVDYHRGGEKFGVDAQSPVDRDTASDNAAMTPAAARRAIAAAKADDAFGKRYVNNDPDTVSYMHALHRAAYPEPSSDSPGLGEAGAAESRAARPGVQRASAAAGSQGDSQNGLAPWMSEATAAARKALTDIKFDSAFVDRYLDGDRKAFDHVQGLIRTAYPEPDASGAGAEGGATDRVFRPWSPPASGDGSDGVAPWLRDAFATEATRAPDGEADADSTLAPWMGDWKPDWLRRSQG